MTLQERERRLRDELLMIKKKKAFVSPRNGNIVANLTNSSTNDSGPIIYMECRSISLKTLRLMVEYYEELEREETKIGDLVLIWWIL